MSPEDEIGMYKYQLNLLNKQFITLASQISRLQSINQEHVNIIMELREENSKLRTKLLAIESKVA